MLTLCIIGLTSCDKYLDIQPKGKTLLTTVTDYNQWLTSMEVETSMPNELNRFADNIDDITIPAIPVTNIAMSYLWYDQFSLDVTAVPILWARHYKSIYYFNTVLSGIDEATNGTEKQKASLKAEALLGRALEYLYLVNEYGKSYDPATASTDLAVPFVELIDLNKPIPERSTVKFIYDQIVSDITAALPNLPTDNSKNRFRGTVAGAYSILARTYLYMHNYPEAQKNAQLALANGPNTVIDYNVSGVAGIGLPIVRTEAIYARMAVSAGNVSAEVPTVTFLRSFATGDLRLKFWYLPTTNLSFPTRGTTLFYPGAPNIVAPTQNPYQNWGTSVAEMRLIIAEGAARSNDLSIALTQLDLVRKCRIPSNVYTKFSSAIQETVIQTVLKERVFEMPFNGTRWFDMRRLDAEGRMPTVIRQNSTGATIATLAPGSPRYTLQIPLQIMYYHPDWIQNP